MHHRFESDAPHKRRWRNPPPPHADVNIKYGVSERLLAKACYVALNGTDAQFLAFVRLCAIELGGTR